MLRLLRCLYSTICLLVWRSPLGYLFVPLNLTLDDLTQQIIRCRVLFEKRRALADAPAPLLENWEQRLEQMEWEHVRRLQRAGMGDDPFVRSKTVGGTVVSIRREE